MSNLEIIVALSIYPVLAVIVGVVFMKMWTEALNDDE